MTPRDRIMPEILDALKMARGYIQSVESLPENGYGMEMPSLTLQMIEEAIIKIEEDTA